MLGILDAVIIVLLLAGIIFGFKRGLFCAALDLFGTVLIILLSYALKNPFAYVLFNFVPFFKFENLNGSSAILNILLYEIIAFSIVFSVLSFVLRLLKKSSKLLQKLLDFTIIGGFISNLLGAVVGFVEFYLLAFIIVYIGTLPLFNLNNNDSKLVDYMLNKTPVLTSTMDKSLESIKEITDLTTNKNYNVKGNEYNNRTMDALLKGGIITSKSAKVLVKRNLLPYKGINEVINKYDK